MKAVSTILVLFAAVAVSVAPLASQTRTARPVIVSSPDGRTRAELSAADGMSSLSGHRGWQAGSGALDDRNRGGRCGTRPGCNSRLREVPQGRRALPLLRSACRGSRSRQRGNGPGTIARPVLLGRRACGQRWRRRAAAASRQGRTKGAGRPVDLDDRRRPNRLGGQARQLVREPIPPDHAQAAGHGQHRLPAHGADRTGVHRADRGADEGLRRSGGQVGARAARSKASSTPIPRDGPPTRRWCSRGASPSSRAI